MAGKVTGRIEVLVNGQLMLNKPGAVASGIGSSGKFPVEKEPILGDTGLHGFSEKPVPAQVEVKISDRDDILLTDFMEVSGDGTVIFRAAGGGKAYTLRDATCLGNFSVTGGEGEVSVKFVGSSWTESIDK